MTIIHLCYAGNVIKSLFGFIIINLLFLASLGLVAYRLQSPDFVLSQARSVNLYGRLTSNIEPILANSDLKSIGLESSDAVEVLRAAVDGEQFYGFVGAALKSYLPWLTGQTDSITFSYDLAPAKEKMTDELSAKILARYNSLPVCTTPQLRGWDFKDRLPSCQLAPKTVQEKTLQSQATSLALKVVEPIPDRLTAGEPSAKLTRIRSVLAQVFRSVYVIWGLTVLLISLFLLIYRRNGLTTLATCFLFVGLLQVAFGFIGWDWIARNVADLIGGSGEAKALIPLGIDLASVIIQSLKTVLGNISIACLIFGGVLLVWGLVSKLTGAKTIQPTGRD